MDRIDRDTIGEYITELQQINAILLKACKRLVKSSPCQNGCSPDDMTCDTRFAKYAINRAEKII